MQNKAKGILFISFNELKFFEVKKVERFTKKSPTSLNVLILFTKEKTPVTEGHGGLEDGRGDRIRTCDPLFPKQMRYQAAPLPDWHGN